MNKKDKNTKQNIENLYADIWPQERDVIFRPDRLKYVRKLKKNLDCVFCEVSKHEPPQDLNKLLLYKSVSNNNMVVLNKYPYNTAHLMVIPTLHTGDLITLDHEIYVESMTLIKEALKILKQAYNPAGFNIGLNHGDVAGAGIPDHLHWHVIPRWHGDTNFFPVIAETKVLPESLEASYNRLQPLFKELKL